MCNVGTWNACSVANKSATIQEHIISENLDIFSIVETHHESSSSPGLIASTPSTYNFIEKARPLSPGVLDIRGPRGGGISIIYKDHFRVSAKDTGLFTTFEHLTAYFTLRNIHIIIVVIYRPGSESISTTFFTEFAELLTIIAKYNCQVLILGDINIHFDEPNEPNTKKINRLLSYHGLEQMVQQPTHNRSHTLDVVITRTPNSLISHLSVTPPSLSDHSIIHFRINHKPPPIILQTVERRSFHNFNISSFQCDLEASELFYHASSRTATSLDTNELFTLYDSTMSDILDKHAPRRTITIRKKPDCPWFDRECAISKRTTRRLERKFLRDQSNAEQRDLWRSQIKVQRRLFQHKRSSYLRRSIEDIQGDGRTLWKSLHSLLSPPAETSSLITPDELLDYFGKKTEAIRDATKDAPPPIFQVNSSHLPGLAAFDEVSPDEVEKLLSDTATKQCELDSVPVRLLKTLRHVFAPILALLINISLSQATLPEAHKHAIIRPRLKKPGLDPSDPANYRPISNLSFVSKLIERVVHRQLLKYVEMHNLLPPTQSGFRRYHSTETAVVKVYNDIVLALDAGLITALLLLDFSAAFDCVDHTILLKILHSQFGITSAALLWFFSFLSSRSHKVRLGAYTSRTYNILFGVPQGSILGPLLFILYTSNIVNIASRHGILIHLYADDTQLYIKLSVHDISDAKSKLINCVKDIQAWCAAMRLKLNATKTELIWFDRKSADDNDKSSKILKIQADCSVLPSDVVRDLGVLLDSQLTMTNHIASVAKACYFHLRRIRQVRRCLNEQCLRVLVQALVISRIDYCNSVLAGLPSSTLQPLVAVLNTAARLIKDLGPRDHITPSLRQLHWLPIPARITFKICLLMYNVYTGSCPSYMSSLVTPCESLLSRRCLRSASKGDFVCARSQLKFGNRALSVAGPVEWNKLPESLRHSTSVSHFKSKLKAHLFRLYYD